MQEGSSPLGPYRQMIWRPADEDLGGGQHVEAPGRRPPLGVLIIDPEAHLQSSGNEERLVIMLILVNCQSLKVLVAMIATNKPFL